MSRSKLPAIAALLRNTSTDPAELVSRLEPFDNIDAEVLHDNGDGHEQVDLIQAAAQRMQWLMQGVDTDSSVEVAIIRSILHVMPPRVGPVSAKALWSANFPSLMAQVFEVLVDNIGRQFHQQQLDGLLIAILQCVQDICASDYRLPAEGKQPDQRGRGTPGRDRLGDLFLQPLLEFLPNTRFFPLPVRRHAAITMLDLVTRSKHNQQLVAAPENRSYVDRVYLELLPAAADYATQLDLLETLFRVGRSAGPDLLQRYLAGRGQVLDRMQQALRTFTRNSAEGAPADPSAVDLGALLRTVVLAYNRSLGEKASVFSYQTRAFQVLGMPGVRQADPWVDLSTARDPGGGHFSLTVFLPDPDDPEPAPETLTVPYSDVSSVTLRDECTGAVGADICEMAIDLSQLPEVLENVLNVDENGGDQDAPGACGGGRHDLSLLLTLHKDDAKMMMMYFPKRCRDRLVVQSQDPRLAELSQPLPQVGRASIKMSRNFTGQFSPDLVNDLPQSQWGQQQAMRSPHDPSPPSVAATGLFDVEGNCGRAAAVPAAQEDEDDGAQHSGSNAVAGLAGSRQLPQRLRQQRAEEQEPVRDWNRNQMVDDGHLLLQGLVDPSEVEKMPGQNEAGDQQQQLQEQGQLEQLHGMLPQPQTSLPQQQVERGPKEQRQGSKQQSAHHPIAELQPPPAGDQATDKVEPVSLDKGLEAITAAADAPLLAAIKNGIRHPLPTEDRAPPMDARVKAPSMLPPPEVATDMDNSKPQGIMETSEAAGISERVAAKGVVGPVPTSKGVGSKATPNQSLHVAAEDSGATEGKAGRASGGGGGSRGKAGRGSEKKAVGANRHALHERPEAGQERTASAGDKVRKEGPVASKQVIDVGTARLRERAGAEIKTDGADGALKKRTAAGKQGAPLSTATGEEEVGRGAAGGADHCGLPHKKPRGGSAATDKGSVEEHQLLPRLSPQPIRLPGTVSKTFSRRTPPPSMLSGGVQPGRSVTIVEPQHSVNLIGASAQATPAGVAGGIRPPAEPSGRPPMGPTLSVPPARGSGAGPSAAANPMPRSQLPRGASASGGQERKGAAATSPNMKASLDPIEDPDTPFNATAAAAHRAGSYLDGGASGAVARGKAMGVAKPAADAKHGGGALTAVLPQGDTLVDRDGVTEAKKAEDLPVDDNEPMEEEAITGYNTSAVERLQDTAASPPEAGPAPAVKARPPEMAAAPKPRVRRGGAAAAAVEAEKGSAYAAAGGAETGATHALAAQKRGRRVAVPGERKRDPYAVDGEITSEEGGGAAARNPPAAKKARNGSSKGPEQGKARASAAQGGKKPVPPVPAPPPAAAGDRPQRQAKVKALEALADQLAPTQASPKAKSPHKQREQAQQQQKPESQAERQVHQSKQAQRGAGAPGLSKGAARSGQMPAPSDEVAVVPATLDGAYEQRLRGDIPGQLEAGAPSVVECRGAAANAGDDGGGRTRAEALRHMYDAWDNEEVAAEDEAAAEEEEEATAAVEARCRRSSFRVEGDLLLGIDPRVTGEEQRRPPRLVVDFEAPNVRLGADIAREEEEAGLLDGAADGDAYPNADVGGVRHEGDGGTVSALQVGGVAERALNLVLASPSKSILAGLQQVPVAAATVAATVQARAAVTATAVITQQRTTLATAAPRASTSTPGLPWFAILPAPPKSATAVAAATATAPPLATRPGPSNPKTFAPATAAPAPSVKPPRGKRKAAQPTPAAEAAGLLTAARSGAPMQLSVPPPGDLAAPGASAPGAGVMCGIGGAGFLRRLGMELSQEEPNNRIMSGGGGGGGGSGSDEEGGGGLGVGGGFGRGAAVGKRLSFSTTTKLAALKPLPFMAMGGIRTPGGPTLGVVPTASAAPQTSALPAAAQRSSAGGGGEVAGRRRAVGDKGAVGIKGAFDGDKADAGETDMTALTGAVLRALMEGGDGEDEETGQLQQVLAMMMQRKKRKVAMQQAALLRETQQRVAASVQEIEDAIAKEAAAVSSTAQRIMGQIQTALGKKLAAIEAIQTRRNEELSAAWEDYTDTYNRAAVAERELQAMLEKKRQEFQRRVDTLSKAAAAQLTEAERRVSQARSTASRIPGLQSLLAQLEAVS